MIKYLIVDLFCGAGGSTCGIEQAVDEFGNKVAKTIVGVNHDDYAISTHELNHPDCKHFREDIRKIGLAKIMQVVREWQKKYPKAKLILWASLECTNFSNAKGGKPKNPDSRTLAEHLFRYIDYFNFQYIFIENVREFQDWGPLDHKNKPIKNLKGVDYKDWTTSIKERGYYMNSDILNAANYGVPTIRKRLFLIFSKYRVEPFPEPTHFEDVIGSNGWKPVYEVLEFDKTGDSIFNRPAIGKKPLVENTLKRIYAGLQRYGANFLSLAYSGNPNSKNRSLESPAGSVTTIDHHQLIQSNFIMYYYGNGYCRSVTQPAGTVTTKDRMSMLSLNWIDAYYSGSSNHFPIDKPTGSVTTIPKLGLVTARIGSGYFLYNPQYGGQFRDITRPCHTLIARMDKAPPYLIETPQGLAIKIEDNDSPTTIKIKEYMAENGIADIMLRGLFVSELSRIQGFPESYKYLKGKTKAKKCIGNAVPPAFSKNLIENLSY